MKYAVVMAAGKGTRMKSELPKVLFPVLERPMIEYVLDALEQAGVDTIIVVVGYRSDLVRETLAHRKNLEFVEQTEQLGTGHAVMTCQEKLLPHNGPVMVVAGDSPMIQVDSIRKLFSHTKRSLSKNVLHAFWAPLLTRNPKGWDVSCGTRKGNFRELSRTKMLPRRKKRSQKSI